MAAAAAPPPVASASSQSTRQATASSEVPSSTGNPQALAKGRRKSVGEVDISNPSEGKNGTDDDDDDA